MSLLKSKPIDLWIEDAIYLNDYEEILELTNILELDEKKQNYFFENLLAKRFGFSAQKEYKTSKDFEAVFKKYQVPERIEELKEMFSGFTLTEAVVADYVEGNIPIDEKKIAQDFQNQVVDLYKRAVELKNYDKEYIYQTIRDLFVIAILPREEKMLHLLKTNNAQLFYSLFRFIWIHHPTEFDFLDGNLLDNILGEIYQPAWNTEMVWFSEGGLDPKYLYDSYKVFGNLAFLTCIRNDTVVMHEEILNNAVETKDEKFIRDLTYFYKRFLIKVEAQQNDIIDFHLPELKQLPVLKKLMKKYFGLIEL